MEKLESKIFKNILAILDSMSKKPCKLNWHRLEPAFKELIKVLQDEGYEENEIFVKITERMNLCDQQAKEFLKYCFKNTDQLIEDVFKDQGNKYYNEEDLLRILDEEDKTQILEFGLDSDTQSRISNRFDSQSINNSQPEKDNNERIKEGPTNDSNISGNAEALEVFGVVRLSQSDTSFETPASSSKISKRLVSKPTNNTTSNLNQKNKPEKDNTESTQNSPTYSDTSKNDTTLGGFGAFTQSQFTSVESLHIEFPSTQSVINELRLYKEKGENSRHNTERTQNSPTNVSDTFKNDRTLEGIVPFSQSFISLETHQTEFPSIQTIIDELPINKEKQADDQPFYTREELLKILEDDNQSLTSHDTSSTSANGFTTQSINMPASNSNQNSQLVQDKSESTIHSQTNDFETSQLISQEFGGCGVFTQSQCDSDVETPIIEFRSTQSILNEIQNYKKDDLEKQTDDESDIINESHSMDSPSAHYIVFPI